MYVQSIRFAATLNLYFSCEACFLKALQLLASKAGVKDAAKNAKIHTAVHLGPPNGIEGFGLSVDIKVEGVEDEKLIQAAHEVFPSLNTL